MSFGINGPIMIIFENWVLFMYMLEGVTSLLLMKSPNKTDTPIF